MSTKCITITDEAYNRLSGYRKHKESFSEVIKRILPKSNLFDLIGVLSKEEAACLKREINRNRIRMREEMERRVSRLQ